MHKYVLVDTLQGRLLGRRRLSLQFVCCCCPVTVGLISLPYVITNDVGEINI